ncbi:MAG: peptidoglycan DD-metalloendopeptidase family protein [Firmicutes bacterium]|nr:peptidoglycan DD-metalloendopeptidase family protein [Bacillota bacterium]
MATIQVTPGLLLDQAKALRSKIAAHEGIYRDIRAQAGDITSVWKGKSQAAFWASFEARDKQLRKFAEDMEAFAQLMETAAQDHDLSETYRTKLMQQGVAVGGIAAVGAGATAAATFPNANSVQGGQYPGHTGLDYGSNANNAPEGTHVTAAIGGTVVELVNDYPNDFNTRNGTGVDPGIENSTAYANRVVVRGDDGKYYLYAHLQQEGPGLAVGQRVNAGDWIGNVGNTGNSVSSHLHLEIRHTNQWQGHMPVDVQSQYINNVLTANHNDMICEK